MMNITTVRSLALLAWAFLMFALTGCLSDPTTVEGRLGSFMSLASPTYSSEGNGQTLMLWEQPKSENLQMVPAEKGICVFRNTTGAVWGIQAAFWSERERKLHMLMDVDVPEPCREPPERPSEDYLKQGEIATREYIRRSDAKSLWHKSIPGEIPLWQTPEGNVRMNQSVLYCASALKESLADSPGTEQFVPKEVAAGPPRDMESYLFWFAGYLPHPALYPKEKDRLTTGKDTIIRSTFVQHILGFCFSSFDLSGLGTPGFRQTLRCRFIRLTEAEFSRPSERRVRIEASILIEQFPGEASPAGPKG